MDDWTWLGPPLDVRPLFPVERGALLDLLTGLEPPDWDRPTVCPGWTVGDIVSHILHDHMRRLSGSRDGHPGAVFEADETLPEFLTRSNEEFVRTARQFSPRLRIELLAHLGPQLDRLWAELDMARSARIDVSWAAPGRPAPAWLDVAREFTEFWVHERQIRDAVGRPAAEDAEMAHAVLDTFARALPLTLSGAPAPVGTAVRVVVPGAAGGRWTVTRRGGGWSLAAAGDVGIAAEVELDAETLWRLATGGITPEAARPRVTVRGDEALGGAVLNIVAIVR